MPPDNRLLVAGLVLFGSAVIARNRSGDGIGISPNDLPEESEVLRRKRMVTEDVPRSSWKSKRMQDTPRTETVAVTGRRLAPITKTMFDPNFDPNPEVTPEEKKRLLDEQKRLANERGARLAKEAAEDEVVVTKRGVKVALPAPKYEVYGDPDSIIKKYIDRASESLVNKPDDYLVPTAEERRILTLNQNRRQASMKAEIVEGTRNFVDESQIASSCEKRIPKMFRIRKLLDRPDLLEPSVLNDLKARWTKFQAQCIDSVPEVMNRYARFNPR